MADLFTPAQPQTQQRNWTPILVGLLAVIAVIGILVAVSRKHGETNSQSDAYASKLQLSNLKMSAAENYVGGSVTYLDVNITNTGDKTLVGADMKAVFKNSMGQVVQTETLPLRLLTENKMGGYDDLAELSRAPIAPGQTKTVRMSLEHISADWDQNYPALQLADLKLKD